MSWMLQRTSVKRSFVFLLSTPTLARARSLRITQAAAFIPTTQTQRRRQQQQQQKDNSMRGAPFVLLTTAAFLSYRPLCTSQAAENSTTSAGGGGGGGGESGDGEPINNQNRKDNSDCPYYGCPLVPHDVHYSNETIKQAFEQMRGSKRVNVDPVALRTLQQSISDDESSLTLTLIGYKGGQLHEQINQDRAVIVAPYYITKDQRRDRQKDGSSPLSATTTTTTIGRVPKNIHSALYQPRILQGVFDGHAPLGERVSEFVATELPKLLASKLRDALSVCCHDDIEEEMEITTRVLSETFIELDKLAPGNPSGGCTASVVLKQGDKIYLANAGDSRSFIVSYRASTGFSEIVYMTREDKPELPEEKARVEAAGGQVYIPVRGTSRVVYHDPNTGSPTGLAMSRSIGDWAAGKMGVIPDPIVQVLDIDTLVSTQLYGIDQESRHTIAEVDEQGNVIRHDGDTVEDDVYIFAISATDGMMDYLHEDEIAKIIAHALFDGSGVHPITACEHLVFAAAQSWQEAKQGRYRDDIAIAVSTLRRPPTEQQEETLSQ